MDSARALAARGFGLIQVSRALIAKRLNFDYNIDIAKRLNFDYNIDMNYSIDFRRKVLSVREKERLSIRETAKRFHIGSASV